MHPLGCAHVCSWECQGIGSTGVHPAKEPPSWKSCLGSAGAFFLWPLAVGHSAGPENPAKHPCCWFESQEEVLRRF